MFCSFCLPTLCNVHTLPSVASSKTKCTGWLLYFFPSCQALAGWMQSALFAEILNIFFSRNLLSVFSCNGLLKGSTKDRENIKQGCMVDLFFYFSFQFAWNVEIFKGITVDLGLFQKLIIQKKRKETQLYDLRQTRLITSTMSLGFLVSIFRGESDRSFSTAHDDASWLKTLYSWHTRT